MRILIVSKSFPPRNSAQALQVGKVAEAIADTGIEVRVLAGIDTMANDREHTPDNCSVVYVPYHRLRSRVRVFAKALRLCDSVNQLATWVRRATAEAQRQIETFRPDCFLTSSMPFQTHLVGLAIKRLTGLPWVASFSDPWPQRFDPPPYYRRGFPVLRGMQMSLSARVIRDCDIVHMPSQYGIKLTEKVIGFPIISKAVAIPHIGYYASDADTTSDHFGWLAHVGQLTRERVSEALLAGVQEAHRKIPHRFKGLLCVGIGCAEFKKMIRRMRLDDIVKLTGQLSGEQAIRVSRSATALLVIEADMAISPFLPSKFADYALTGKPIIAVTPPVSAIRDYLESFGGGSAVRHDADEIAEVLIRLFSTDTNATQTPDGGSSSLAKVFSSTTVGSLYGAMFGKLFEV